MQPCDHLNIKSQRTGRVQGFFRLRAIREQDVGIVAFGLIDHQIKRLLVDKQPVGGQMLAETVV